MWKHVPPENNFEFKVHWFDFETFHITHIFLTTNYMVIPLLGIGTRHSHTTLMQYDVWKMGDGYIASTERA